MNGQGVTQRYAALALAMEFGLPNVDAMLESMSCAEFNEWMTFLNIRARLRNNSPQGGEARALPGKANYGRSKEEQQRMSRDILQRFTRLAQNNKTKAQ